VIGTAFSIARMIDIPVNRLLGWGMDKTRTPIGRYRFWTLLGVPLLMAGVYFLFIAPAGIGPAYLITWVIVL
jgi:Na+/melibiose symporter-like transporter